MSVLSPGSRRSAPPWAPAAGVGVLAALLLLWAKWGPSWMKVPAVAESGSLGRSILTGGAGASPGVSLSAGPAFAGTYFLAIWPALAVGLAAGVSPVVAAALVTLPALSLPSLLMVRRSFPRRLLATATVVVMLVGVASSAVVAVGGPWSA